MASKKHFETVRAGVLEQAAAKPGCTPSVAQAVLDAPCERLFEAFPRAELESLDAEGRVVMTDHGGFVVVNVYGPAISTEESAAERYAFKLRFYQVHAAPAGVCTAAFPGPSPPHDSMSLSAWRDTPRKIPHLPAEDSPPLCTCSLEMLRVASRSVTWSGISRRRRQFLHALHSTCPGDASGCRCSIPASLPVDAGIGSG